MAEEDDKLDNTLEKLAEQLRDRNDREMKTMEGRKKDQSHLTLKTIAKAVLDIRHMLAKQILDSNRSVSGAKVSEKDPGKKEKPEISKVEMPSNWQEALAAVLGAVTGFIAEFGAIFKGIIRFVKESKMAAIVEEMFLTMRSLFKADGAIGKLFQPGAKMVRAIIRPVEIMFETFAGLFKSEGAIGKLFQSEASIGKLMTAVKGFTETFTSYVGKSTEIAKQSLSESKLGKFAAGAVETVIGAFNSVVKGFREAGEVFKGFEAVAGSGKFMKAVKAIVNPFIEFFNIFKPIGGKIAEAFGKLAPPLLIILEVVEIVKGAFQFASDEVDKGGNMIQVAIAGVIGAFTGFVNFWLEIPQFLLDGISWLTAKIFGPDNPVTKFLDSFNIVDMFSEFMMDVKDFLMTPGESLTKVFEYLGETVKSALAAVVAFDFASAFANPVDTVMRVIMLPYTLLKDAVAWIVGKLGFEEASEDLKNFDIVDTIKSVINAPFVLLGKAVNWVMGFLGFDFLKVDLESIDVVGTISKILMAPFNILVKAVDWVLDKLGFDSLVSYMPDMGGILQKASDWLTGLIDDAIDWIKDKLSFFGGDSETRAENKKQAEVRNELESEGIVKKEGIYGFRKNTIDDETLRSLTDNQLGELSNAYRDDEDLFPVLTEEADRRKMERSKPTKTPGTVQTAIQPQSVVEVEDKYVNPSAVISGTQQQSNAQTQEMMVAQSSLEQTKTQQSSGGGVPFLNAPSNVSNSNNSVVNNTFTQSETSSRDDTDMMFIYRATGTSR